MTIRPELIDELPKQLTKAIIERCLETELDTHLGYPKYGRREEGTAKAHNGSSRKRLKGAQGVVHSPHQSERQVSVL